MTYALKQEVALPIITWVCHKIDLSHGGGHVVSVMAFYSNDLSSYPDKVNIFFCGVGFENNKINKRGRGWPILKRYTI